MVVLKIVAQLVHRASIMEIWIDQSTESIPEKLELCVYVAICSSLAHRASIRDISTDQSTVVNS